MIKFIDLMLLRNRFILIQSSPIESSTQNFLKPHSNFKNNSSWLETQCEWEQRTPQGSPHAYAHFENLMASFIPQRKRKESQFSKHASFEVHEFSLRESSQDFPGPKGKTTKLGVSKWIRTKEIVFALMKGNPLCLSRSDFERKCFSSFSPSRQFSRL